jgi:hypothetical protein
MVVSGMGLISFLSSIASLPAGQVASISLVAWWFVLCVIPLYFISGLFMLRGKNWARQLYVVLGASSLLFGFVVFPFTLKMVGQFLFLISTVLLLYRTRAHLFFQQHSSASNNAQLNRPGFGGGSPS